VSNVRLLFKELKVAFILNALLAIMIGAGPVVENIKNFIWQNVQENGCQRFPREVSN